MNFIFRKFLSLRDFSKISNNLRDFYPVPEIWHFGLEFCRSLDFFNFEYSFFWWDTPTKILIFYISFKNRIIINNFSIRILNNHLEFENLFLDISDISIYDSESYDNYDPYFGAGPGAGYVTIGNESDPNISVHYSAWFRKKA